MTTEQARQMLETRSEAGQFLQWLISEKGVLPNLDIHKLATEYAIDRSQSLNEQSS